jgi:hypothetical protein
MLIIGYTACVRFLTAHKMPEPIRENVAEESEPGAWYLVDILDEPESSALWAFISKETSRVEILSTSIEQGNQHLATCWVVDTEKPTESP